VPPCSGILFIFLKTSYPVRLKQVNGLNWFLIGLIDSFCSHGINVPDSRAVDMLSVFLGRWA
jgi:hypothetical protein